MASTRSAYLCELQGFVLIQEIMKVNQNAQPLSLSLLVLILFSVVASCGSKPTAEMSGPAPAGSAAELIASADKLYAERAELGKVREGLAHLRQARALEPNNYEAAWRLARMNYYLGDHTDDTSERDQAFTDGVKAGKEAVKLQENKPEGHFWLGANYGGQAQHSALSGMALVEEIRREMQTVIRLDESFLSGSAYMALARTDLERPPVMGGDPKKAVENLEKGLKFGENNALLRYYLAQAYFKTNRKPEARQQLETILNMQPDPNYVPEHNDAVAKARELLKKV